MKTSAELKAAYTAHRAAGEKELASVAWAEFLAAQAAEAAIATRKWADKRMDRRTAEKAVAAEKTETVAVKAPSHMYRASTGGGYYDSCAAADDEENGRPAGYSARHSI
jgi:hypothetical protein